MGSSVSNTVCTCGNPVALRCDGCRTGVCRLCVRKDEKGAEHCLACRAAAIERAEEKAVAKSGRHPVASAKSSARLTRAERVRKQFVFFPVVIVLALAAMTAVAGPLLSEAHGAHAERKAESALRAIVEAEQVASHGGARAFLTLDELQARRLVGDPETPGYEVTVELARDRHTFWARAIPTRTGLRGIYVDAKGDLGYF